MHSTNRKADQFDFKHNAGAGSADEFDEPEQCPEGKNIGKNSKKTGQADEETGSGGCTAEDATTMENPPVVPPTRRRSLLEIQIENIQELYGSTWCMSFRRILYLIHVEDHSIHEYFGDDARLFLEWETFHKRATYGIDNLLFLFCLPFFYIAFFMALIYRLLYLLIYEVEWDEICEQLCIAFLLGLCLTTQNIVRMGLVWIIMPLLLFTPHPFKRLLDLKCRFKFIDTLRK